MTMRNLLFLLIASFILLQGCVQPTKSITENNKTATNPNLVVYPTLNDSLHRELMMQGAVLVHKAMFAIKKELIAAMKKGGPEYALEFCNTNAIPITDSLADTLHVGVKRVAKKFRNPDNETQGAENEIYKEYIITYLGNKLPRTRVDINKQGHPVYYKRIDVKAECMVCHGTPYVDIPKNVANKIKHLYPNDQAINFKVGEPRGMWAITFNDILIRTETP